MKQCYVDIHMREININELECGTVMVFGCNIISREIVILRARSGDCRTVKWRIVVADVHFES